MVFQRSLSSMAVVFVILALGRPGVASEDYLPTTASSSRHSLHVAALQEQFAGTQEGMTLFFVDQDWLRLNALALSSTLNDPQVIGRLFDQALSRQTPYTLSPRLLEDLGSSALRGFAHATRISGRDLLDRNTGAPVDDDSVLCVINGRLANQSADHQMRTMMGADPRIMGPLASLPIRQPLSLEVLHAYSDFHELGHCLDEWYIPTIVREGAHQPSDRSLSLRHRSEVFAEVFATLYLAQLGHRDVALKRANHRLVTMATHGSYITMNTPVEDIRYHMSYVYAFHRALRATQESIDSGDAEGLSLAEIKTLSKELTETTSFEARDNSHAFTYLLSNRLTTPDWDELIKTFPHLIPRLEAANLLYQDIEGAFRQVFDWSGEDLTLEQGFLRQLDFVKNPRFKEAPAGPQEQEQRTQLVEFLQAFLGDRAPENNEEFGEWYSQVIDQIRQSFVVDSSNQQDRAGYWLKILPEVFGEMYLGRASFWSADRLTEENRDFLFFPYTQLWKFDGAQIRPAEPPKTLEF